MGGQLLAAFRHSDETVGALRRSDDEVDAVVSALVALMVQIDPNRDKGFIEPIPPSMEAVAKREGWIALPRECSLTRLGFWLKERQAKAGATA